MNNYRKYYKLGIFVLIAIGLLSFMIISLGKGGNFFFQKRLEIVLVLDSAMGVELGTPVQIAGVTVGEVKDIRLNRANKAELILSVKQDLGLSQSTVASIKASGLIGDSVVELSDAKQIPQLLKQGDVIASVQGFSDFNSVTGQVGLIAEDVKAITAQMRKLMAGDNSPFDKTVRNIEKITDSLARVSQKNERNIDAIIVNLHALSQNLNTLVAQNMGKVGNTATYLEDITGTVSRGEGTVGKLIKDDETVNRLNDALENLNNVLGSANRLRVDMNMHTEYLSESKDFKNYVGLALRPRPDKAFLFEFASDPNPSFDTIIEDRTITSGSASSRISTTTQRRSLDKFVFSAQLAKKFYDFTIRGGLIESSGGVGLDYQKGPIGLSFSAFDFRGDEEQNPHLKAYLTTNLTRNIYLMGGVDDFISSTQDPDWFGGAGLSFTDDDVKSLIGIMGATGGLPK